MNIKWLVLDILTKPPYLPVLICLLNPCFSFLFTCWTWGKTACHQMHFYESKCIRMVWVLLKHIFKLRGLSLAGYCEALFSWIQALWMFAIHVGGALACLSQSIGQSTLYEFHFSGLLLSSLLIFSSLIKLTACMTHSVATPKQKATTRIRRFLTNSPICCYCCIGSCCLIVRRFCHMNSITVWSVAVSDFIGMHCC